MSRKSQLLTTDFYRLDRWARQVKLTLSETPYLVGSATEHAGYRDVDVRVILDDDRYDRWASEIDLRRLGLAISMWGQTETGLPIDFQFQRMTEANAVYDGTRNALGLSSTPANLDWIEIASEHPPTDFALDIDRRLAQEAEKPQ